jgi:hypothetical protein
MQDQPDGQVPNSLGEIEDPAQVPPAPAVHPESREISVDPEVDKTFNEEVPS